MTRRSSQEREIREIAIVANSGEATEAHFARLDELVRSESDLANYAARVFDQQASLAWQGSMRDDAQPTPVNNANAMPKASRRGAAQAELARAARRAAWSGPVIAAGIAFLLGAAGVPALRQAIWPNQNASLLGAAAATSPAKPAYEARLIRSTACLWDGNSTSSREIGSWLNSGESLHLLEGLAEFKLDWASGASATVALEGPAAMILTSEGMPMLRFGRLTATINSSFRPFVLETPVGRLVLPEYGSIGVSAYGNDAEIHVFDGSAILAPAWTASQSQPNSQVKIDSASAIRVQENASGELSITRHAADEGYFAAQQSMSSDALVIPPAYVDAVKAGRPIAYWRFERGAWPHLPNEMGPRFPCYVHGSLGTTAHHGNEAIEFGVTDQGGEILCDEKFDDAIRERYSIEFWIKPSHYHVGAVISLVGDSETSAGMIPHGMLLEMGGTGLIPSAVHHPGRIRFLHRSPASNDTQLGTSCYSTAAYTLRKWQHVVAVKDGAKLQLYINGQLAGESEDASRLPAGLRLLAGRLYPARQVRPFIGQLDELAIFDHALSQREIVAHYRLIRPKTASKPSI